MTDKDPRRFVFNGHAVGVGAHFHRLEQHTGLNLNVPMLGASVLPVTGGVSESKASNFCYEVDKPIRKRLLSVRQVDTRAHGYVKGKTYHTDVETRVEHSRWADLVHFDLLSLKMETTHDGAEGPPHIFLKDLHIEGLCLGSVKANVEVDEEPFSSCGTMESIEHFWAKQSDKYRRENAARFPVDPADPKKLKKFRGSYICSIVRNITLSGRKKSSDSMSRLATKSFGTILKTTR